MLFYCETNSKSGTKFRVCLHWGGGPQVACPDNFLFYFDHVYMIGGVTRLGGLPGLPGRVTLSAGVTICHVNVSRWGNPPSRGCVHDKKRVSQIVRKTSGKFIIPSCAKLRSIPTLSAPNNPPLTATLLLKQRLVATKVTFKYCQFNIKKIFIQGKYPFVLGSIIAWLAYDINGVGENTT